MKIHLHQGGYAEFLAWRINVKINICKSNDYI